MLTAGFERPRVYWDRASARLRLLGDECWTAFELLALFAVAALIFGTPPESSTFVEIHAARSPVAINDWIEPEPIGRAEVVPVVVVKEQ